MKLFPQSAHTQLEFDKITQLLAAHCQTEHARSKAEQLRIHTRIEFVETELRQTHEYSQLLRNAVYFPNDHVLNLAKELKLLSIPGAVLTGEQFIQFRKLAESIEKIFRWFDAERKTGFPALTRVINNTNYNKAVMEMIDQVLDAEGQVKDNASPELKEIRL